MILFQAHSGIRYLVLLAGAVALAYALYGVATRRPYDASMRRLGSAFAGLVHMQVLLGFGLLFTRPFYSALIGHIFLMVFAAVVAQLPSSVMRRRQAPDRTYMPHVVATLLAIVLMAMGIMAIQRPVLGTLFAS